MGIQTLGLDLAQPGGIVASLPSVGWNVEGDLDDNDAAIGSHTPAFQTVARVRVVPANSIFSRRLLRLRASAPALSVSERSRLSVRRDMVRAPLACSVAACACDRSAAAAG